MTSAAWQFEQEHQRILRFVFYVTNLATSTDEKARIAVKALYQSKNPTKCREDLANIEKRGAVQALRSLHRPMMLEMMLSRAVENFLAYIAELLTLIFRARPETLRSSEMVRLDAVLKHKSMDELIRELADRRVNQLSYQGMRDLAGYVSKRLGFELLPDLTDLHRAVHLIECRNIIAHNRGIVNEVFVHRTGAAAAKIGERLELETDAIFDDIEFLAASIYDADVRASTKFELSTRATNSR